MTGSYAYLARHEDMIPNLVAGLNLDMVGEDQSQTGSVLAIERPPEASASFTPDLLEWLQETVLNDFQPFDGIGHYSCRYLEDHHPRCEQRIDHHYLEDVQPGIHQEQGVDPPYDGNR